MVETAGTKLQRARQLRHLSVDDVSRATKIRPHQIADLEADDYSNFANLAYAKSFLVAYGKFLHVDTRPYMEAFADASTFGTDDYQYLSDEPIGVYRVTRRATRQSRKTRRRRIMLGVTAAGVVAIGIFCRLAYISYERLGDFDKVVARREAREHPDAPGAGKATATADAAAPDAVPPGSIELPALAAVETVPPGPTVPLPGDGSAIRGLLSAQTAPKPPAFADVAAAVRRPAAVVIHAEEPPQPQQVVNNGPIPPVN